MTTSRRRDPRRAERRGFTLLEVAIVLVTLVALSSITVVAVQSANRSATASATRQAVTTILVRSGEEAIANQGRYTVTGVRRAVIGVSVSTTNLTLDCGRDIGPNPPEGVYAVTEGGITCYAVSVGPPQNAAGTWAGPDIGQVVAHINDDRTQLIVVAVTATRQCAVGIGRSEQIDDVYLTDSEEVTVGARTERHCFIPIDRIQP